MKIRVEYNAEPYPQFNPTDKNYEKKSKIAGAGYPSEFWELAKKDYGYMISVVNGTAVIVRADGQLISKNISAVRVVDEEYVSNTLTK